MTTAVESKSVPVQLTLFDLEDLEGKVRAGLKSFVEVGDALARIRDGEGYRLRGFKSFDEYCEKQFNFSLRHGQRLIAAAQTAEKVEQIVGEAPANEAVARQVQRVAYSPKLVKTVQTELKREGRSSATSTAEAVARVVTAVLKKNEKGNPSGQSQEAQSAPAEPTMPEIPNPAMPITDYCPTCGDIPETYSRNGQAWYCGSCGAKVVIGVMAEVIDG